MKREQDNWQSWLEQVSAQHPVWWVGSIAALYFAAARISLSMAFEPEGIAAIWPPEGIFLSAIILTRKGIRPYLVGTLFLTDLTAELLAGSPFPLGLVYALALTGGASVSSWLVIRFIGEPIHFRNLRQVLGFIALAVVFSNGLFSLVAAAGARAFTGADFAVSWFRWAVSDGIGNLIVTPFILSWTFEARGLRATWALKRVVEAAVLFFSLALLNAVAFNFLAADTRWVFLLVYLSFLFLMWAALRIGIHGVTLALVMIAVISVYSAASDLSMDSSLAGGAFDAVLIVQFLLAAAAVPSLMMAGLMHERREDRRRVAESEHFLQMVVDGTPDAIYVKDRQGRYLLFNASSARIMGKASREVIGRDDHYLFPEEEALRIQSGDRQVVEEGRVVDTEDELTTADGVRAVFLTSKRPMWDDSGELIGLLGISRDITDRHRAEAERNRLAIAIEQAGETVLITDRDGRIEYVNPSFERTTGYSREEAIGQTPRILQSGQHDDEFYRHIWRTISAGRSWEGRIINKRKDGELFTEDATISPILDPSGKIVNYVAVKRDISGELRLAEQYQQAQKMESIGRLAGGVAHDFNNLLTVITGYCDLLLQSVEPGSEVRGEVEEIRQAGERATALTQQLLAFSRKQIIEPKVVRLDDLVAELKSLLTRLIGEDIYLQTRSIPSLGSVKVDPGQFQQIVMNLVVNARDALPDGGKILIETSNIELDDEYCLVHPEVPPGSYVLLAVSDNGKGMPDEVKKHIFEPFFTTKQDGRGTGLGLATTYGIVKQSGGAIEVYSEVGLGTTFKIYLPRHRKTKAESPREKRSLDLPGGKETVLVVEDEELVLNLCVQILGRLGYKVLQGPSPDQALTIAAQYQERIDLLLTDVVMGGMNGVELASQLIEHHPEMRVLYTSGYTDSAIVRHGVLDEGVSFIGKPYSPMTLAQKIREVLDQA